MTIRRCKYTGYTKIFATKGYTFFFLFYNKPSKFVLLMTLAKGKGGKIVKRTH